jgi:hypothetical protein
MPQIEFPEFMAVTFGLVACPVGEALNAAPRSCAASASPANALVTQRFCALGVTP